MKCTYEVVETYTGSKIIKRVDEDGQEAWIPMDKANADYQAYLAWLENPNAEITTPTL
jgi:hypothetical protein